MWVDFVDINCKTMTLNGHKDPEPGKIVLGLFKQYNDSMNKLRVLLQLLGHEIGIKTSMYHINIMS